jgi:hypothetical protein
MHNRRHFCFFFSKGYSLALLQSYNIKYIVLRQIVSRFSFRRHFLLLSGVIGVRLSACFFIIGIMLESIHASEQAT